MTVTPSPVITEPAEVLADRLAALAAELLSLEQHLRPADAVNTTSAAELALARVLRGSPTPQDTMAIGVPIRGARLVVVRCGDERAATLVRRTISGSRRVQVACIRPAEMTALVAEYPRRADQIRRAGDAVRVATTACRTGGTITAGISSPLDNASQVAAAYQEATEAASLAVELSKPWAIADEHWAVLGTRRLTTHLTSALTLANPLSRLRQYDNEQGTDLVTTIGTWLARNCDTASTAAALSVHPNTLRYRLRRAGEVSGLDLADAKVRALTLLLAGPSSV